MNRKTLSLSILGLFAVSSFFSCKKEKVRTEVEKPTIEIKEVGLSNSKTVYAGHDLHLEAEVKAPGKIANVKLQITLKSTNYGWDFIKTYTTGYAGLKNADFHEHIDVPENATIGEYEVLIMVTDELGNKVQDKAGFDVKRDLTLPSATGTVINRNGNLLNVTSAISAPNKLAKVSVEVQSSAWTKMFDYTDATWWEKPIIRSTKAWSCRRHSPDITT